MKKVHVLLSTYNGETYLRRQVDSILAQKDVEVVLHVRDDGSSDHTKEILKEYQHQHANVILYEGENVGYIRSFLWLVRNCGHEEGAFYAFSDQDDVWDEDKLISAVRMLEPLDATKPLAYYSDLKVVDQDEKFIRLANSWEGTIDKYKLAVFIGIRGCTMVFNDVLHAMLEPYEITAISGHDTYVALIAFWLGEMVYDPVPHINYRQTGSNLSITGTSRWDKLMKNFLYVKKRLTVRANIHEKNAKELLSHYDAGHEAQLADLHMVADYKKNIASRFKLLCSRKYKNFSLMIRLFNDLFIVLGKL